MAKAVFDTHGEILAAAARRFAVTGYRGTSLQDIAREVGCSKATVLYHFANKEALLAELMSPAIAVLRDLDDQLTGLTGAAAQQAAGVGFVDLAVRFRGRSRCSAVSSRSCSASRPSPTSSRSPNGCETRWPGTPTGR